MTTTGSKHNHTIAELHHMEWGYKGNVCAAPWGDTGQNRDWDAHRRLWARWKGEIHMDRVAKGQILSPTDSKNTRKEHHVNGDTIIRGREDRAPPRLLILPQNGKQRAASVTRWSHRECQSWHRRKDSNWTKPSPLPATHLWAPAWRPKDRSWLSKQVLRHQTASWKELSWGNGDLQPIINKKSWIHEDNSPSPAEREGKGEKLICPLGWLSYQILTLKISY